MLGKSTTKSGQNSYRVGSISFFWEKKPIVVVGFVIYTPPNQQSQRILTDSVIVFGGWQVFTSVQSKPPGRLLSRPGGFCLG